MATINKKPTKAHKNKKVVKAHQGMAHIPRQRPASPIEKKTRARRLDRARRAVNSINERTRGPIAEREINPKSTAYSPKKFNINPSTGQFRGAPRPQAPTIQQPKPVRQPSVIKPMIKPVRPIPIQSDAGGGRGQIGQIGPRKLTSREKRRRDNALKSEFDEIRRQASKRRRPRRPIRQPRVAMPYNPAADDFGIGRPNVVQPYKPNPLVDNIINVSPRFNPSTTLTDRFNKQIQAQRDAFNKQNKNNLNQNRLQMQRNKGGDVKKYATGGLNKGMTKSRTKYGTVDNKKK